MKPVGLTVRLTIAMALAWIIPAVSITIMAAEVPSPIHDHVFLLAFSGTAQLLAVSFFLWRRVIAWTFGRVLGTGGTIVVVLTHLLLWQPLWNAGCVEEDILRLGQSLTAGGLWVVVTAYVWWGFAESADRWRRQMMSPNAVRLICGMALIPFIPGFWAILVLACEEFVTNDSTLTLMGAHGVCGLVIVLWWWFVWRRAVTWTPRRTWSTVGLAASYLLVVTLSPLLPDAPDWVECMQVTLPLLLTGVWFWITARVWRNGAVGAAVRASDVKDVLKCTTCGYSLIGLYEARCPECGRRSTLDELFEGVLAAGGDV